MDYDVCQHVYATVKETGVMTTRKICGGSKRVVHAYTSITETVELRVFSEEDNDQKKHFMLKYDGKLFAVIIKITSTELNLML